ncbi:MAG: reductive dehalogenase [Phycisphaerae bacterium]|nr:reductive dehalogenase [Phycisphaerae bacterium]
MNPIIQITGWISFATIIAMGGYFAYNCIKEHRGRALKVGTGLFGSIAAVLLGLLLINNSISLSVIAGGVLLVFLGGIILTLPTAKPEFIERVGDVKRVDERDTMFARFYRLKPDSKEYEEYYQQHPELKNDDDEIRQLQDICTPGSKSYKPGLGKFIDEKFGEIHEINQNLDVRETAINKQTLNPVKITNELKQMALDNGAVMVGMTKLNPNWVYSHNGRSEGDWAKPVKLNHKYAIVIAVEMDHQMCMSAPKLATTAETAIRYHQGAVISNKLTDYILSLGYQARSHIDGNYRVMCQPIAVDAGLGELGRMGLLITEKFGPRVRLAVVTTDLELIEDKPISFGVQDFCDICKKCASNCPSGAISENGKANYNGILKWQIDMVKCYRFWRIQGTDCGLCMKVCPYSHPDNLMHNSIRWVIKRNKLARRLALLGDDVLYGRRVRDKGKLPEWVEELDE